MSDIATFWITLDSTGRYEVWTAPPVRGRVGDVVVWWPHPACPTSRYAHFMADEVPPWVRTLPDDDRMVVRDG